MQTHLSECNTNYTTLRCELTSLVDHMHIYDVLLLIIFTLLHDQV